MAEFQDLFSKHAACYAAARPRYPAALFDYLAGLAPARRLAWDCGTGNGQAAVGLADRFERVIATDASAEQLAHASAHPRIEYRVARAESSGLAAGSMDLVTVAQAIHWFALDAYYSEVRRVLRPGGVLAAWCYGIHAVSEAIDAVTHRLYHDIVGPCWPPDRHYVDECYETIPFPFDELRPTPAFECREDWTLGQYVAYLESWSAVQRFREMNGHDPIAEVAGPLRAAWGAADVRRTVRWPIHLRVGRVPGARRQAASRAHAG